MITLSDDGYVRLTFACLKDTPLVHLLSGLDEKPPELSQRGINVCGISGYTEWVSTTTPVITIGWDWQIDISHNRYRYVRVGPPRTNIMLLDSMQHDLAPLDNARLLEVVIDAIGWQGETSKYINARYAYVT
jgi:hypothetical protein